MEPTAGHVLVVDDEPVLCELVKQELVAQGFDCRVATDSRRARSLLDAAPRAFDVLIADVCMPHLSGLELLAHAKSHMPECKVILISGNSRREFVAQALLLGAYDYVEKPFDAGELVEIVKRTRDGENGGSGLYDRAAEAMTLSAQARHASLDSVSALVRAVEAKDPYTRRHSEQVAHYAVNVAKAMGLSGRRLESVRVAALLHDIGKIGVPDRILTKAGPLTSDEFQFIRHHPALGSDILSNITLFGGEASLVRHHHERWDGQGYPDGLAGEDIPFISRIIQAADCIDAMLMERIYKKSYSVEKMLAELIRCSGTQFDPKVASASIQWCRANREKLILPGKIATAEILSA